MTRDQIDFVTKAVKHYATVYNDVATVRRADDACAALARKRTADIGALIREWSGDLLSERAANDLASFLKLHGIGSVK